MIRSLGDRIFQPRYVDALADHPLPSLLASGVRCCLAADDPTLMGTATAHGLLREFVVARRLLGLEDD